MPTDLILYDGNCGLCDRFVQFVLRRDQADRFQFAPLQSDLAKEILRRHGKDDGRLDTVVLVQERGTQVERIETKGRAALTVMSHLGKGWPVLASLRVLPTVLLNFGYDIVAKNRFRFFGRLDQCRLPTPAERSKFLGL